MKKLVMGALLATTALSSLAYAESVAQAKRLADDTYVSVTGKITRALSNEKFELQDSTGKIRVEIDDDYGSVSQFVGKTVTVSGEIDKGKGRTEIDAHGVRIH